MSEQVQYRTIHKVYKDVAGGLTAILFAVMRPSRTDVFIVLRGLFEPPLYLGKGYATYFGSDVLYVLIPHSAVVGDECSTCMPTINTLRVCQSPSLALERGALVRGRET